MNKAANFLVEKRTILLCLFLAMMVVSVTR